MSENEASANHGQDLVDELKEQLHKTQSASDQYQKQIAELQRQLGDALRTQAQLRAITHYQAAKLKAHENEQSTVDKDEHAVGLQWPPDPSRIPRPASPRTSVANRKVSETGSRRESSPSASRYASQPSTEYTQDKEKVIENLKLDLAENHMRRIDLENTTAHRIEELEKRLAIAQSASLRTAGNAELHQSSTQVKPLDSKLGENLATSKSDGIAGDRHSERSETSAFQANHEKVEQLELEVLGLKDQNNALTLYVNRIIARLLEQNKFEDLFEDGSVTGNNPLNPAHNGTTSVRGASYTHSSTDTARTSQPAGAGPSILKRAGSIFSAAQQNPVASTPTPSQRPPGVASTFLSPMDNYETTRHASDGVVVSTTPIHINENPHTAISIPLRHTGSVRRPRDRSGESGPSTASSRQSSRQRSPNTQRRSSYFGASIPGNSVPKDGPGTTPPVSSAMSDAGSGEDGASGTTSGGHRTVSGSSEPLTSMSGRSTPPRNAPGTGTVFNATGSSAPGRMRPLRLVQEKVEADEAAQKERKKANRASWVSGWFGSSSPTVPAFGSHAGAAGSGMDAPTSGHGSSPESIGHGNVEMAPPAVPPRKTQVPSQTQAQWPGMSNPEESSPQKGRNQSSGTQSQNQWPAPPPLMSS